jgi:hypothetical protein
LNMIAYGGCHGTHGTDPTRRGDIGEDAGDRRSPAQGRSLSPYMTTRLRNFPTGGGSRDRRRQSRWRIATPTDRRIVAPRLSIHDPGTPSAKSRSRRGEAEGDGEAGDHCKGTEQSKRLQGKIASISAAEAPEGRLRSARGMFFPAVSSIT